MGTKVAIIYGNVDRKIHMIVKPTNDAAIPTKAGTGETITTMILSTYNTFTSQKALAVSLGLVG